MQSMSVTPGQVAALSKQIAQGAQGIRSELDRLESEVGKLRSSWSGEAQQQYDEAQRRWNKSVAELQQLLQQISAKTDEMSQQYVSRDKSSAGRFAL